MDKLEKIRSSSNTDEQLSEGTQNTITSTRQTTETIETGFGNESMEIFFGDQNKAKVLVLGTNKDRINDNVRDNLNGTGHEIKMFWELLNNPSSLKEEVLKRQSVIHQLMTDNDLLETLSKLKNNSYLLDELIMYAFDFGIVKVKCGLGGCGKKEQDKEQRIKRLLENPDFNINNPFAKLKKIEKITLQKKGLENGEDGDNFIEAVIGNGKNKFNRIILDQSDGNDINKILIAVKGINIGFENIKKLINFLESVKHPFFINLAKDIGCKLKALDGFDSTRLLELLHHRQTKELNNYLDLIKELSTILTQLGTLIMVTDLFKRDGYSKANFNESKPIGFEKGWNILEAKSVEETWNRSGFEQVLNDSPEYSPLSFLQGGNMSGKSYYMKMIMYVQMSAQSFGYTPSGEGNFHVHNSIGYIDRGATDGPNNLSAYGNEVESWLKILELDPSDLYLFSDEGFSTTSPEDATKMGYYIKSVDLKITQFYNAVISLKII